MYGLGKLRRSSTRWIIAGTAGHPRASSSTNACRSVVLLSIFSISAATCLSTVRERRDCSLSSCVQTACAQRSRGTANLVHIVGVERGWLTCWKEPSPSSTFVKDYWTRHNALFNPNAFPDLASVQLKWAEIER